MQRILILLSFIEGASLLALLFIAMPMKYLAGDPTLVRYVGMGHGMLFLGLLGMIMYVAQEDGWPKKLVWFAIITSSVPFGMFALEKKLRARSR